MASDGKKVAIVGSGLIGRCWAMLFARAGYNPVLFDIEPKQLDAASESILSQLKGLESGGLLRGQRAEDVFARVKTTSNLRDAVTGAVYLQECVPEVLDLKRKIFGQLDEIADDSIVLASSTSCITASSFTENLKHRDQCLVAHPINPPHYIPLVELVPAPWTRPAITQRARDILKSIGQSPVTLKKEVDGFVVNRLQYALLMEAWRLVEDGVCSPEDVDTAVSEGLGLRWSFMGPFQTIDLNAPEGVDDYCRRYGEGIFRVCETQKDPRKMEGAAVQEINEAMRRQVPLDKLPQRREWRDAQLAALARHKLGMSGKEE